MSEALYEIRFADLIHLAQQRSASDIHLVPGLRVALRVDGKLEFIDGPLVTPHETELLSAKVLDDRSKQRFEASGDVTTAWTGIERVVLRVHVLRSESRHVLAIRLLPQAVPKLDTLFLPPVVATFAQKQRGLVIFAGPTGSGKSTSMAALIREINEEQARRIVTIEDPIEYRHASIRSVIAQREVGRDVSSFASAVIGALRADPDVIMLGEMRDAATMRAAMTAAETGHLVLTTLHTGDAVQTVDRIVDAFEGTEQAQVRSQLSASLVAVVCQRLVSRASSPGRRVVAEVLVATEAARTTIREGRTHQLRNLMLTGRQSGMQTLEHHLNELLSQQAIPRSAALLISERHSELRDATVAI